MWIKRSVSLGLQMGAQALWTALSLWEEQQSRHSRQDTCAAHLTGGPEAEQPLRAAARTQPSTEPAACSLQPASGSHRSFGGALVSLWLLSLSGKCSAVCFSPPKRQSRAQWACRLGSLPRSQTPGNLHRVTRLLGRF